MTDKHVWIKLFLCQGPNICCWAPAASKLTSQMTASRLFLTNFPALVYKFTQFYYGGNAPCEHNINQKNKSFTTDTGPLYNTGPHNYVA